MKQALVFGLGLALVAGQSHAANLLKNGGFETGNLNGWTVFGDLLYNVGGVGPVAPEDGNDYFGSQPDSGVAGIYQIFSDTPGVVYDVSGWYNYDYPVQFTIKIDDSVLFDFTGTLTGWTRFTGTFVGTGSDTLTLTNLGGLGNLFLDNFSVSASAPEPEGWLLMLAGLGLTGALLRRRSPASAPRGDIL